jgi:hypothetical protein
MVRDSRNVAPTVRIICKHLAEVLAQVLGQLAEGQIKEGECIYLIRAFHVHAAD